MEQIAVTCIDLLGIERAGCDSSGCTGFARPRSPCGPLDSALLTCVYCGYPSRAHRRADGTPAASVLSRAQASTVAGEPVPPPGPSARCSGSAPEEHSVSIPPLAVHSGPGLPEVCWEISEGLPCPLHVGSLVRACGSVALVQELCPKTADHPSRCTLAPCLSSSQSKTGTTFVVPAIEVENQHPHDDRARPHLCPNFEDESSFGDLVFQAAGLRRFADSLRRRRCRIVVLGGSISLQKSGYRTNLVKSLERRGVTVEDLPAAIGVAGSKPLSLIVEDAVVAKRPDLLIIEVAVNDGDELLEGTPRADVAGVLRATEGIVRTVRRRLPDTSIVFVEMLLRDDCEAARLLKTGSEAWRDSRTEDVVGWYHDVAPRLHRHVCKHYGAAQIDLVPAMKTLSTATRNEWFRDDCHHTEVGGDKLGRLLARLLLWAVRQRPDVGTTATLSLAPALDAQCWCGGRTFRIPKAWVQPPCTPYRERDPMTFGEEADWVLVWAGGRVTLPFRGRACGLVTLLGPDAPTLSLRVDGGEVRRLPLLDPWCYYWRDAVVLLCEGLADSSHILEVEVEAAPPDHSKLKRQPKSPLWDRFASFAAEQGRPPQQLWLLHACALDGDSA